MTGVMRRAWAVFIFQFLVGCFGGPTGNPGDCAVDSDCARGEACVLETCRRLCQTDRDCRPAEHCGAGGVCEIANGECEQMSDCLAGGGRCAGSPSAECVGGACLCGGCTQPDECGSGYDCFSGSCLLEDGELCADDAECGSVHCECADGNCQSRRCNATACPCGYVSVGNCVGNLTAGTADPDDCAGEQACFFGSCLTADGSGCDADSECGNGQCECTNATCATRACTKTSCTCKWGATGTCTANVADGQNDPLDCPTRCQAGVCIASLGEECRSDQVCESGTCECVDAFCTTAVCAANDCMCGYGSNGACALNLPDGTQDVVDCEGDFACYGGACRLEVGASCYADADCGSGHCECVDANCDARVCAESDCLCGYGILCDALFAATATDPEDCDTAGSGCFEGSCLLVDNQACTDGGQCGSGSCFLNICQPKICDAAAIAAVPYAGTGSAGDPFVICTAVQLNAMASQTADLGKTFWLGADIDLSGYDGVGANPTFAQVSSFYGTLDGRGWTISGFSATGNNYVAFMRTLQTGGVVENLTFSGASVSGNYQSALLISNNQGTVRFVDVSGTLSCSNSTCGGIAATSTGIIEDSTVDVNLTFGGNDTVGIVAGDASGTIRRVDVNGSITSSSCCTSSVGGAVGFTQGALEDVTAAVDVTATGGSWVGGLAGQASNTVARCTASGAVSAGNASEVGGLVGFGTATIVDSSATGSVSAGGARVGGLVGSASSNAVIENSFAGGAVEGGSDSVGGLVGDSEADVLGSWASGNVLGDMRNVGGLIGHAGSQGAITDCYATGTVTGQDDVGGLAGVLRGTAFNTYAAGAATSSNVVGGLVGDLRSGSVMRSFAVGRITGGMAYGLIGDVNTGSNDVQDCYWYDVPGDSAAECWQAGIDPDCALEPTLSNFNSMDHAVYAGWDFAGVWQENPSALPTLRP